MLKGQEKAAAGVGAPPLGLYLHVPFCATRCDFCAFYEEEPRRADLDRYLRGVEREFAQATFDRPVETVFWGGGTPGLLPARDLRRLGAAQAAATRSAPAEWTVEMAPSTVKADKLRALRDLGVNRISVGVQSFQPALLEALGRRGSPGQAERAVERVRAAGFDNLNLDLIIAAPGQGKEGLLADLRRAIELGPEHISTYCLTFEDDTKLLARLLRGEVARASEAEEAELYELTWNTLEKAGYAQYEISNFARPGRACRHNIATWEQAEWVGLGPSAASHIRGRRWANPADLDRWLAELEAESGEVPPGGGAGGEEEVILTPGDLAADCVVFGLRMNRGIDLGALQRRFPGVDLGRLDPLWEDLQAGGLAEVEAGEIGAPARAPHVRLTLRGRLLADTIGVEVLRRLG